MSKSLFTLAKEVMSPYSTYKPTKEEKEMIKEYPNEFENLKNLIKNYDKYWFKVADLGLFTTDADHRFPERALLSEIKVAKSIINIPAIIAYYVKDYIGRVLFELGKSIFNIGKETPDVSRSMIRTWLLQRAIYLNNPEERVLAVQELTKFEMTNRITKDILYLISKKVNTSKLPEEEKDPQFNTGIIKLLTPEELEKLAENTKSSDEKREISERNRTIAKDQYYDKEKQRPFSPAWKEERAKKAAEKDDDSVH